MFTNAVKSTENQKSVLIEYISRFLLISTTQSAADHGISIEFDKAQCWGFTTAWGIFCYKAQCRTELQCHSPNRWLSLLRFALQGFRYGLPGPPNHVRLERLRWPGGIANRRRGTPY